MPYDFDTLPERRSTHSLKWNKYDPDVLPMWVADMDFATPQPILDALHRKLEQNLLGYESDFGPVQSAVCDRMARLYGWEISPEMVIMTPGVVAGFNAAARLLCGPGDGYLIQPPVYSPFLEIASNANLKRLDAPLVCEVQAGRLHYRVDFDAFEKTVRSASGRLRMFLLCHPHNPTGSIYSPSDLARLAEICLRENVVIVSDEIHSELLLGGAAFKPMAVISPEVAARTITLIAPSKTFNIAGLFCGVAVIPDAGLRKGFMKTLDRLAMHISSLNLVAAQAAFSGACDDWLEALKDYLTTNRDLVLDFVAKRLPGIRTTAPEATYMAWWDCTDLISAGKIQGSPYEFFLKNARVAFNDGAPFGSGGEGFVRFNFGCPRQLVLQGLERVARSLK